MRASPAGPRSLPGLRNHFFNGITGFTSSFRPLPYNFRARVQPLLFTLCADLNLNGVPVSLFDFEQPPPIPDTPLLSCVRLEAKLGVSTAVLVSGSTTREIRALAVFQSEPG